MYLNFLIKLPFCGNFPVYFQFVVPCLIVLQVLANCFLNFANFLKLITLYFELSYLLILLYKFQIYNLNISF